MGNRWQMELRVFDDKIEIWETGCQKNKIEFDSSLDLSNYTRRNLANYELFLRENNQIEIADKIKSYLGKIIRARDCDDLLVPNGHYKINMPLNHIKKHIDDDIEDMGLDLNPNFQRAHVWDLPKRIKYMEFLLKGGESNPIYFNHESYRGEYVIVDGKQRLTSILMFLDNEFPVFKEMDSDGIGYYAREFDMIPNDVIFVINDLPNRKLVLQWYLQMNEGNVAHAQEELDKVRDMLKEYK